MYIIKPYTYLCTLEHAALDASTYKYVCVCVCVRRVILTRTFERANPYLYKYTVEGRARSLWKRQQKTHRVLYVCTRTDDLPIPVSPRFSYPVQVPTTALSVFRRCDRKQRRHAKSPRYSRSPGQRAYGRRAGLSAKIRFKTKT